MEPPNHDNILNFIYQRHFTSWNSWLTHKLSRWESNEKRHHRFVKLVNTIVNSFNETGFSLKLNKPQLMHKILTWAYTIDEQHYLHISPELTFSAPKHRDLQKDYDNYTYCFNDAYWADIRSIIDSTEQPIELFTTENASNYFWANLPDFLYRFIDIEHSSYITKHDEAEKQQEEEIIQRMIDDGLLMYDKKGRLVTMDSRNIYPEETKSYRDYDNY